jgi:hypothetical protein
MVNRAIVIIVIQQKRIDFAHDFLDGGKFMQMIVSLGKNEIFQNIKDTFGYIQLANQNGIQIVAKRGEPFGGFGFRNVVYFFDDLVTDFVENVFRKLGFRIGFVVVVVVGNFGFLVLRRQQRQTIIFFQVENLNIFFDFGAVFVGMRMILKII